MGNKGYNRGRREADGIGQNGNGRGYSAYCSVNVGEVGNFTNFIPTRAVSPFTVTAKSVAVTERKRDRQTRPICTAKQPLQI